MTNQERIAFWVCGMIDGLRYSIESAAVAIEFHSDEAVKKLLQAVDACNAARTEVDKQTKGGA